MRKSLSEKHLLCCWAAIVLVCTTYAQTTHVPLLQVLKELNHSRGVYFLFTDRSIGEKPVVDSSSAVSTEQILTSVLKGTGLTFRKVNDLTFVILSSVKKEDGIFLANGMSIVGNNWLSGVVTSESLPLAGVTVKVKGATAGTSTDENGVFSIQATPESTLLFSSIGYEDAQVTAAGADMRVSLKEAKKELNEVVLTALGIKKQYRSLGYATSVVPGADLTQSRETNLGNAFSGKVAGVNVAGDATGPYGSSRVIIRGNSSVMGNNQPLYVVDGVPYDNTNWSYASEYGGKDLGDGLSNISPDDIEDIQILKGVAASALYGYRGGNGAILVSTKSGSDTRGVRVDFNNNLVADRINDQRDYQYVYGQGALGVKPMTQAAAIANPYFSWGPKMDGSNAVNFLGNTYKYLPAENNFKNFYQTGLRDQSSLSFYGGNAKGHFHLGLSNLYLSTVIPNSNMKDVGINLNSGLSLTKHLQVTLSGGYVQETVKDRASFSDAPGNLIASTLYLANSFDIRWLKPEVKANGSELLPGMGSDYFNNPYFVAYKYQNNTVRNRLIGAVTLKYNIFDNFFIQGQATLDGYVLDLTDITPTGTGYLPGGNFTQYELNYHEVNENYLLGWFHDIAKNWKVSVNAGGNSQDNVAQDFGVGAVPTLVEGIAPQNAAGPFNIPYVYTASNILEKPYTRGYSHYRVNSLYGSVDLQYKNIFFLTATARNDWFSTLSINSDHYLYPSLSGSFQFSDLLRMPKWITSGKWRASYAQASDGATPYQNVLTYGQQGYTISGQVIGFVSQSYIPNSTLRPVAIQEWETGFNMDLFKGRLNLDAALYDKRTSDDILPVTISPTSGYQGDYMNVGKIRNEGVEALITAVVIKAGHFQWKTTINYANNASKVLDLGPGISSYVISGAQARWGSEVNISNVVGLPYGQIMGFAYKRDSHHNIIYDSIGEPVQTGVVPLGSGVYRVTGGWGNEFRYRNFTLSFLLDYKFGAKIYSQSNLLLYFYGLQKSTLQGRMGGYVGPGVTETGEVNTKVVPVEQYFQDISASGADHIAEQFVYDASFIKLRSFSLAYSFPAAKLQGSFIRGLSISLVGRNLLTLMKHTPNIDPESGLNTTNGQGLELSEYPSIRSLGCNINVKF